MEHFFNLIIASPFPVQIFLAGISILGLWYGSEKVIWGIKRIARKFGISELIIGLTIVSIGSSLPEIFVNISAGLNGVDDIGVGNIVGSCFVQISFILGLCVLVGGTMKGQGKELHRDALMVVGSIMALFLLGLDGEIQTGEALLLIFAYVFYTYYLLVANRKGWKVRKSVSNLWLNIVAFLFGVALVWFSAEMLLKIGINAGEQLGVNQGVIGLFSGIGTSIPELSISLIALLRRSSGLSLGNLLGSNITDPLFSLGVGAVLAHGYKVSDFLLFTAIPIWFVASFGAMSVFYLYGKMTWKHASVLVAFYIGAFLVFLT